MAKVRLMTDSNGKSVKVATPGMAVTVSGWKTLPKAGDEVLDGKESDVKKALANRVRMAGIAASLADVDAINATRKEERERKKAEVNKTDNHIDPVAEADGPKELKLIIKADVSGSAEAIEGALQGIGNKEAMTKIVSAGVGDVTDSDVLMAKAVNGTISQTSSMRVCRLKYYEQPLSLPSLSQFPARCRVRQRKMLCL